MSSCPPPPLMLSGCEKTVLGFFCLGNYGDPNGLGTSEIKGCASYLSSVVYIQFEPEHVGCPRSVENLNLLPVPRIKHLNSHSDFNVTCDEATGDTTIFLLYKAYTQMKTAGSTMRVMFFLLLQCFYHRTTNLFRNGHAGGCTICKTKEHYATTL